MGWGDILPVTLISLEQWLQALTSDPYPCCWVITACDRRERGHFQSPATPGQLPSQQAET